MHDAIRLYIRQQQQLDDVFEYEKKQAQKLEVEPDQIESIIDDYRQGK